MQEITEDQHLTLRRWALTVGKRPGKSVKLFLKAEKGLSEEQIDTWWSSAMMQISQGGSYLKYPVPATQPTAALPDDVQSHQYLQPASKLSGRETPQKDYISLNDNYPRFSPVEEDIINPSPAVQQVQHWSRTRFSHSRRGNSTTSSADWTSPLLSTPSDNWDAINHSDRSSGVSFGSSSRTGNTASSLFSFTELLIGDDTAYEPQPSINPCKLTINTNYPALEESRNNFILENGSAPTNFSTIFPTTASLYKKNAPAHSHNRRKSPNSSLCSSIGESFLKAGRAKGNFPCTACHRRFTNKGDWKRHEGSQCEPQTYWICMLDDPAISAGTKWVCAFCDASRPGSARKDILNHLEEEHKYSLCIGKILEARSFRRKDKLKNHLRKMHTLSEGSNHWEQWHQGAATQDKSAWGCGFCGVCLFTWEGRLEHIAEHYEKHHLDISQWSHSLVIKGLLKQPSKDFNVLEAWKDLVGPDGDSQLEWPEDDAIELKRKLEFSEGTPRKLAMEALRLATTLSPSLPLTAGLFGGHLGSLEPPLAHSNMFSEQLPFVGEIWSENLTIPQPCSVVTAQDNTRAKISSPQFGDGVSRHSKNITSGSIADVDMRDIQSDYS